MADFVKLDPLYYMDDEEGQDHIRPPLSELESIYSDFVPPPKHDQADTIRVRQIVQDGNIDEQVRQTKSGSAVRIFVEVEGQEDIQNENQGLQIQSRIEKDTLNKSIESSEIQKTLDEELKKQFSNQKKFKKERNLQNQKEENDRVDYLTEEKNIEKVQKVNFQDEKTEQVELQSKNERVRRYKDDTNHIEEGKEGAYNIGGEEEEEDSFKYDNVQQKYRDIEAFNEENKIEKKCEQEKQLNNTISINCCENKIEIVEAEAEDSEQQVSQIGKEKEIEINNSVIENEKQPERVQQVINILEQEKCGFFEEEQKGVEKDFEACGDNKSKKKQVINILNEQDQTSIQPTWFEVFVLCMLGIASFLGWFTIIISISVLGLPGLKSSTHVSIISIIVYAVSFVTGTAYPNLAKKYLYSHCIYGCLVATCILLPATFILYVHLNNMLGLCLFYLIQIVQGFFSSILSHSLIAFSGLMSRRLKRLFWTFTPFSGLVICLMNIFALAISEKNEQEAINIMKYFYFFVLFTLLATGFMQVILLDRKYFLSITNHELKEEKQNKSIWSRLPSKLLLMNLKKEAPQSSYSSPTTRLRKQYSKEFIFGLIGSIQFSIFILYIQTFSIFPSIVIHQKGIFGNIQYANLTLWAVFFLGDMVGKYLGGLKPLSKLFFTYGIIFCRFIFYGFAYLISEDDTFWSFLKSFQSKIIIMFIFAMSNGFATSCLMIIAPSKAKDRQTQDLINFLDGIAMSLGIFIGSLIYSCYQPTNQAQ